MSNPCSGDLVYTARVLISNLNSNTEKRNGLKWIRKINMGSKTYEDEALRRELLKELIRKMEEGRLVYPFDQPPPDSSVQAIYQLIVEERNDSGDYIDPSGGSWKNGDYPATLKKRPVLFKMSPDGGAFLANQPLPSRGVYCYLSVSSPHQSNQ